MLLLASRYLVALPRKLSQYIPAEHLLTSTRLYGIISQQTILFNEEKYSRETMIANVETRATIFFLLGKIKINCNPLPSPAVCQTKEQNRKQRQH
jgi:hypothetical protein